jgi:carbamate kinase
VDAVVDKDRSSALIANQIGADTLFLLTAVEQVSLNYGQPNQIDLGEVSVGEMRRFAAEGHFAPGSMLPKIEAACDFVEGAAAASAGQSRNALITSLERALDGIEGRCGTRIHS